MNIALVTGASGVIGGACAKALAQKGYALALQYHDHPEKAQALLKELPPHIPTILMRADITQETDVRELYRAIEERLGRITLLVNCAGVALPQELLTDVSEGDMELVLAVNVKGAMLLTKGAVPHMLRKDGGAIIHISSMWGIVGASCEAVYSASKGAVNGFVKAMAKELAPSRIRVNAIAPGLVPSPMNASVSHEELMAFQKDTPLGQLISPEEVAEAACYLAEAKMVTGQILSVDGGMVI